MAWYYAKNNQRMGPVDDALFQSLVISGEITAQTLVWQQGMADWQPYARLAPPPPPPPRVMPAPPQPVQPAAPQAPAPRAFDPSEDATITMGMGFDRSFEEALANPSPAASQPEPQYQTSPGYESPAFTPAAPMAAAAIATEYRFCNECGTRTPTTEMMQYGEMWVCGNCKDLFAQKLRSGYSVAQTGAMPISNFWLRFAALLIDGVVVFIIFSIPSFLLAFLARSIDPTVAIGISLLINLVSIAGNAAFETFFLVKYGATPGKLLLHLKVVRTDGAPLTVGLALGRHFAKQWISGLFTIGIGYLIAAFDDERRTLHDRLCNTRVIQN